MNSKSISSAVYVFFFVLMSLYNIIIMYDKYLIFSYYFHLHYYYSYTHIKSSSLFNSLLFQFTFMALNLFYGFIFMNLQWTISYIFSISSECFKEDNSNPKNLNKIIAYRLCQKFYNTELHTLYIVHCTAKSQIKSDHCSMCGISFGNAALVLQCRASNLHSDAHAIRLMVA